MDYIEKIGILIDAFDNGTDVTYVPNGTADRDNYNMVLELFRYFRFGANETSEAIKIQIDEMMMYHFPGDYPVMKFVSNRDKFDYILKAIDYGIEIYLDVAEQTFLEFATTFGDVIDDLDGSDQSKLNDIYQRFVEAAGSIDFSKKANVLEKNKNIMNESINEDGIENFPIYQLDLETKLEIDKSLFFNAEFTKSRIELRAFNKFQADISGLLKYYNSYNSDPSHSIEYLALDRDVRVIMEVMNRYVEDLELDRFGYEEFNIDIETKLTLLDMAMRYRYALGLDDSSKSFNTYYEEKMSRYPYYKDIFKAKALYSLPSLAFPFDSVEKTHQCAYIEKIFNKFANINDQVLYNELEHFVSTIRIATKPERRLFEYGLQLNFLEQRAIFGEINLYLKNRLRDAYFNDSNPKRFITALNALYNVNLEVSNTENVVPFSSLPTNKLDLNYIRTGELSILGNKAAAQYNQNIRMRGEQGHGFAAEYANDLIDNLLGKDAHLAGLDNAKHGADRTVNGELIQTKYYSTGTKSISACFDQNGFKYHENGKPMQIEVPKDGYNDAVRAMEKRISNGELKKFNITDPKEATNIVRKGHVSYRTAQQIAKAGTIESLTFDAVNGVISCKETLPLTFIVSYANAMWQGEDSKDALIIATKESATSLGLQVTQYVLTQQIGRTSIENALRPVTNFAAKQIVGIKNSSQIANSFFNNGTTSTTTMNNLSKMMRGNTVVITVSTIIQSRQSISDAIDGRISSTQLIKDLTKKTAGVMAGLKGAAVGAQMGSVVPGIGNAVGFVTGFVVASSAATITEKTADGILSFVIEDDSIKLIATLKEHFMDNIEELSLDRDELNYLNNSIFGSPRLQEDLKDMYASNDSKQFVEDWMEPYIMAILKARPSIKTINSLVH